MRSIACQSFGVQTVALNPAVLVTVPGRSATASRRPLRDRFDQGRLQASQKLPFSRLCPFGLTKAPSRAVHHHMHPSSNVIHTCLLGASKRSQSALKSCVAPCRDPNSAFRICLILGKSGVRRRSRGTLFQPRCIWLFARAVCHHWPRLPFLTYLTDFGSTITAIRQLRDEGLIKGEFKGGELKRTGVIDWPESLAGVEWVAFKNSATDIRRLPEGCRARMRARLAAADD